jgi:ArsR family transcriptional regulator
MSEIAVDTELTLRRFQALAEETRLRIVQLLSGGELCVCELQAELRASQSRLSFHLKKLKDAGLVTDRREGRWVHYALVPEALEEIRGFLEVVGPEEEGWRDGTCCA